VADELRNWPVVIVEVKPQPVIGVFATSVVLPSKNITAFTLAGSVLPSRLEVPLETFHKSDIIHCNYAKAVHDLARITGDLRLYKKSSTHFKIAANFNPNYYSVFLSWGHALSDLARKTGSAKDYTAAFEKYRRVAEIDPTDTAAHHSWYYALLELVKRSKGSKKGALIEQAKSVSREQKRRRRRQTRN
jgi:tetratricopeptide (TPR) repeat protein